MARIRLSRNFGHQAAISAGLQQASGSAVVIMDSDLQDGPELIVTFLDQVEERFRNRALIRRNRKEGRAKRLAYDTFYRLLARVADIRIPLDSGDFCLIDRKIVDLLNALPERNRFLRGLRARGSASARSAFTTIALGGRRGNRNSRSGS